MIDIKTLKKINDGLITHQVLSQDSQLQEPLYIDANYTYTSDALNINDGIVYFYINEYKKFVFEIRNSFIPINEIDVGGLSIIEGQHIHNLYEYENPEENIDYKYIRITRIINNYYGEGSPDGSTWYDKGYRFLPNAELIGVTYNQYQSTFPVNEIKVYKDPSWFIYGLKEGYIVKIYNEDETELIHEVIVDNVQIIKITDYSYPCNRKVLAWNNENEQILSTTISNIWGGDDYYISIDVDLYNKDMNLLSLEEFKHIGSLRYGQTIRELIYVVNNSTASILATVRVAENSPAYDWIMLEYNNKFDKEIIIPLDSLGRNEFHLMITYPSGENSTLVNTDYSAGKDYLFYLEVL